MDYKIFSILLGILIVNLYLIRELHLAKKAIIELTRFSSVVSAILANLKEEINEITNNENKVI